MPKTCTQVNFSEKEVAALVENAAREIIGSAKTLGTCKLCPIVDCGDAASDQPLFVGYSVEFLWAKP